MEPNCVVIVVMDGEGPLMTFSRAAYLRIPLSHGYDRAYEISMLIKIWIEKSDELPQELIDRATEVVVVTKDLNVRNFSVK